jgi:hypothetical protein
LAPPARLVRLDPPAPQVRPGRAAPAQQAPQALRGLTQALQGPQDLPGLQAQPGHQAAALRVLQVLRGLLARPGPLASGRPDLRAQARPDRLGLQAQRDQPDRLDQRAPQGLPGPPGQQDQLAPQGRLARPALARRDPPARPDQLGLRDPPDQQDLAARPGLLVQPGPPGRPGAGPPTRRVQ